MRNLIRLFSFILAVLLFLSGWITSLAPPITVRAAAPPVLTTENAASVSFYSATLSGYIDSLGAATSANVSFEWGTASGNYTSETTPVSIGAPGPFNTNLPSLSPATHYYFRAKAIGDGTAYGAEKSFVTLELPSPFLRAWGSAGSGDGQFFSPEGIARDSHGNIYVVDSGNYRVQKFTASGQFITKWGSFGSGDGHFAHPYQIAVDSADNVYVTDMTNCSVQKFTSSGQFITRWGAFGVNAGEFRSPSGIAVDSLGDVYVVDGENSRVQKFTGSGQFVSTWGTYGNGDGQLNAPWGVVVDSAGDVHIGDTSRIQKFSSSGVFISGWGSWGPGPAQFSGTFGLSLDGAGNIYVADKDQYRIKKFTASGDLLTWWGGYGSENSQFASPIGVATDSSGNVYVVDTLNYAVKIFGPGSQPVVNTSDADNITLASATLHGSMTNPGTGMTTNVSFEWGLNSGNYTNTTIAQSMLFPGSFSSNLTGLSPGTTYYFRAKGTADGTGYGIERSFTTMTEPEVTTSDATNVIYVSALLNGHLNGIGLAPSANVSFQWGTASGNYTAETTPVSVNVPGNFSRNLAGLSPATTYYFRAKATGNGTSYGAERSFVTPSGATVTNPATTVTTTLATLNGSLDALGTSPSANVSFQWGMTSGDYTAETAAVFLSAPGSVSANLSRLIPGTIYYFRTKAVASNTSYGDERSFVTLPPQLIHTWNAGAGFSETSVALDPSGNVYVVDGNNYRINKFSASGQFITGWGSYGTADGQFGSPRGVAVDSAGNVYVADIGHNRIQKFTSFGAFITKWGVPGDGDGQFNRPEAITVDSAGNVYVVDSENSRIQKFTGSGHFLTKWGAFGSGDGQFSYARGVAVDSTGNVYVADSNNCRIQKFTGSGEFIAAWGSLGAGDGQFSAPLAVALDRSGNVYVVDSNHYRVQKFTRSGQFVTKWGSYGTEEGQFYAPRGVAVDSTGNVYVVDLYNLRIQVFGTTALPIVITGEAANITTETADFAGQLESPGASGTAIVSFQWGTASGNYTNETAPRSMIANGSFSANLTGLSPWTRYYFRAKAVGDNASYGAEKTFVTRALPPPFLLQWGTYGSGGGEFNDPRGGIAVDPAGDVYVADTGNHRIQKFTSSGEFITTWGSYGSANGQFVYPEGGIAVDSAGNVYVVDSSNNRIQKFSSSGQLITRWGIQGSGMGLFNTPYGIAIDSADNVYVADYGNSRIQKFTSSGQYIDEWGSLGNMPGQFWHPRGVAADSAGDIYVADGDNYRVQKFTGSGQYISQWGSYGDGDGQFIVPNGITVDSSGDVYVTDTNQHRVQKFTNSGDLLTTWGANGSGQSEFSYPYGIAGDSAGNVYVVDSQNQRIQVFGAAAAPIVTTGYATDITLDSMTLSGNLTSVGAASSANVSLQWGLTSGNYTHETELQTMSTPGVFSAALTGLSPGTIYYFRAKAVGEGVSYGLEKTASTGEVTPPFLLKFGALGDYDGQFNSPGALAVDSSGNVYVADTGNHRVQRFTGSGQFVTGWGSVGSGDGQFNYPWGVAVDQSGNVYVVDSGNNRIQKFTGFGSFITAWGSLATGLFSAPGGVAVDSSGNVYVADTNDNVIQKFDALGEPIASWGSRGDANGQFSNPKGIAVDSSGNVYVTDYSNHRIQKFTGSGQFVTSWGSYGAGDGQFDYPWGIATDSSGNVYVTDSNNGRIQKFNSLGNFLISWGSAGSEDSQFDWPQGVGVDSHGNIYVADANNNRIQAFGIPLPPAVTTNSATNVTGAGAVLNANLSLGTTASANVSFQWGTTSGDYTAQTPPQAMTLPGEFSANLTGLDPDTTYYFRAKASGGNTTFGVERSFTTFAVGALIVATGNATEIDQDSANLTGALTYLGPAPSANVSFQWGTSPGNYTNETAPQTMMAAGAFSVRIGNLGHGLTYHFRAKAVGATTVYGNARSFTTAALVVLHAPGRAAAGSTLTVTVDLTQVTGLDAASYDVSFDPAVLRLDSISDGSVGGTTIPVAMWNNLGGGLVSIIQDVPGLAGANGSGYLAALHFTVIGSLGQSSVMTLSNMTLANTSAQRLQAACTGAVILVNFLPGDANDDGVVNAMDITKTERIIVRLDDTTPGADANQDGSVDALDITRIERIIVGLD